MNSPLAPQLDRVALTTALGEAAQSFVIEHLSTCTSTSTLLGARAAAGAASGLVLVADTQTAGRGRRGRNWVSAPGHSLTFSLLWRLPAPSPVSGLSLAVGLAVAQALEALGCEGIGLKWPNDIWLLGRKLAGILVETSRSGEETSTVIGIGINLRSAPHWANEIDQAFAALDETGLTLSREQVLAAVLCQLHTTLQQFAQHGFACLQAEWNRRNALRALPVRVVGEQQTLAGQCGDVREDGTLELIDDTGATLTLATGELSLRLAPSAAL